MKLTQWIYGNSETRIGRGIGLGIFLLWLGFVLFMTLNHVVWRDEVRALSLALQGENILDMFRAIHGEGHPAVWYLLLRGAHALFARPEVLQLVSLMVASIAILLLIFRSPFSLPLIALLLISRFSIFEYSVMARNYGISMLLLFLLAIYYNRYCNHGILLGVLLFLLCNCNVHSVLLAGAFILFWLLDIITSDESVNRTQAFKMFIINTTIATFGVATCLLTILPTFNDAAMIHRPDGLTLKMLFKGIFLPAAQFESLTPYLFVTKKMSFENAAKVTYLLQAIMSLLIFGSTLGLVRRPSAFIAAMAGLVGFSMFFTFLYQGGYRHDALWLVFLISLYWIAGSKNQSKEIPLPVRLKPLVRPVSAIGFMLFLVMITLQVPKSLAEIYRAANQGLPLSRSRDLGILMKKHPELHDAIIVADPDFLVEPLSYYIQNQTYLMREQRFGNVVFFTNKARLQLSLDDILSNARSLHQETNRSVIILLNQRLNPSLSAQIYKEGYNWRLITTPEQVRTFQASTNLIESFAPASTDESFDVYTLK